MDMNLAVAIASFMNIFGFDRFMRAFFDNRRTSFLILILSYLAYFAAINTLFRFSAFPFSSLLVNVVSFSLITLNYEASLKKRIVAIVSTSAVRMTIELGVMTLFGIYMSSIQDNRVHTNVSMAVVSLLGFMAAVLLKKFKNLNKDVVAAPMFWTSVLVIPVLSIVMLHIVLFSNISPASQMLASVIMFGITVFMFYLHDSFVAAHEHKLHSALHAQEKEYYLAQCQLMQESATQTRVIRHDMKIHLAAIKGYVTENQNETTIDYLNKLLDDIGEGEIYSSTGNIAIDSIINFKLKNAKQDGIQLDIRLFLPSAPNVDVADLATIIGNLLDNALEAVAMIEEKKIKLYIEFSKGTLYI